MAGDWGVHFQNGFLTPTSGTSRGKAGRAGEGVGAACGGGRAQGGHFSWGGLLRGSRGGASIPGFVRRREIGSRESREGWPPTAPTALAPATAAATADSPRGLTDRPRGGGGGRGRAGRGL